MHGYAAVAVLPGEVRGPAIGGPCDGSHLIAHVNWTGLVKDRKRSHGFGVVNVPGRYVWYAGTRTWNWEVDGVQQGSRAA